MTHTDLFVVPRLVAETTRVETQGDLVEHLGRDGFAWFGDEHQFVTAGVAARVSTAHAASFLRSIERSRDEPPVPGPRAVAALPFAGSGTMTIPAVVVERDRHGATWRTTIGDARHGPLHVARDEPSSFTVEPHLTRAAWRTAVEAALREIRADRLAKVVLARAVTVRADRPFVVPSVLAFLRRAQPQCVVYADGGFVGASPELLVRRRGDAVTARPLAGTAPDASDLVRSEKDAREHRIVVDAVVDSLRRSCDDVHAGTLEPLRLADLAHLATRVTGRVRDPRTSALELALALHPTPAVAGTPTHRACALIEQLEPLERGRYAGPCGWVDADGDGEFVVALRGAELRGSRAVLHAGAGIVEGSDPDREWRETQAKLAPMLQALVRP